MRSTPTIVFAFLLCAPVASLAAGCRGSATEVADGGGSTQATSDASTTDASGSESSEGGSTGGETGEQEGPWRPFSQDSPWNSPIPVDAAIDPQSDALIEDMAQISENGIWINMVEFSIPVFEAQADTPRVSVEVRDIVGLGFDQPIPIPDGAQPDPASDHHLCILDRDAGMAYDMWDASYDGDVWRCGVGAAIDLEGTGVRPPKDGNQDWQLSHGARACGFPLIAGLIRPDEIEAGRIDHALVLNYEGIRSRYYTPPASTAQGTTDLARPDAGIPCGGRIQLDPDLDLDTLGLSPAGRTIALALQEYGAFIGDFSGGITLNADNAPAAQEKWSTGILASDELLGRLPVRSLRVLEIGQIYDDMN